MSADLLRRIYPYITSSSESIQRYVHWHDWEIQAVVQKLYDSFVSGGPEKWTELGIVLEYDGREKEPIKNVLSGLPFAKQKSSDAADFRVYIYGRLYLIIERKTYVDMMGSISERNSMQHLKMMCVPIPHDRKFYLLEQVGEKQYQDAISYQQNGQLGHSSGHAFGHHLVMSLACTKSRAPRSTRCFATDSVSSNGEFISHAV